MSNVKKEFRELAGNAVLDRVYDPDTETYRRVILPGHDTAVDKSPPSGDDSMEPEDEAEPGVAETSAIPFVRPQDLQTFQQPGPRHDTRQDTRQDPRPPLHVTFAQHGVSPNLLASLEKFAANGGAVAVWHITDAESRDFQCDLHRHKQDVDYLPREMQVLTKLVRDSLDAKNSGVIGPGTTQKAGE